MVDSGCFKTKFKKEKRRTDEEQTRERRGNRRRSDKDQTKIRRRAEGKGK